MKIRRFDRRTFVKKAVTSAAIGDRSHVTMRVVPLDAPAPNATARAQDQDAQLQARGEHQPQDR